MVNFSQLYLGIFSLFISFLSFINILYCYYFDLILDTSNFFFVFLISFFFGTLIFFKKKINHRISIYEKILTVILGYILIPVILAIPYYLSINNLNFFGEIRVVNDGNLALQFNFGNLGSEIIQAPILNCILKFDNNSHSFGSNL